MTRVVIADDHPVFLEGLQALLASASDIDVVGRAETGPQAVDTVITSQPDVAILDLNMPGPGGIATIREIGDRAPSARVLVLTMYDDDALVFEAMRAGAFGYVLKGADPEDVIHACRPLRGARLSSALLWPAGFRSGSPMLPHRIRSNSSPRASTRCWNCSPAACATLPSPSASASLSRRCGTWCPAC